MKNLIEQSSIWLQSESCRSGNILDRMEAVVSLYKGFISEEKEEIRNNTGLSYNEITIKVEDTFKTIRQIISAFLRGNQEDALEKTYKMTQSMKLGKLKPGQPLYKCRENGKLFHYSKEEMFHIPFDKRYLIGNQRFSLSGIPCLYLGGSSYICWEELGRKDFNTTNYCGYSLRENVNMFDMLLPMTITNAQQIQRVVLILLCSLAAKRDDVFKPEYILPQCVLHSLIRKAYFNHKLFCLRYYSSHLLSGDADYFDHGFSEEALVRYENYVFPATSSRSEGYSEKLKNLFNQTDTISPMREILLHPDDLMDVGSNDEYLDSQFGLVDSILDEKLGFESKRKKLTFIVE